MLHSIYISNAEMKSGKSLVALGLTNTLLNKGLKVAVFRPIINDVPNGGKDRILDLLLGQFKINLHYDNAFVYSKSQLVELYNKGQFDYALDKIIDQYKQLEEEFDFVVIIGSDFEGTPLSQEFDLNTAVAKNLGSPVLMVSNGSNKTVKEIASTVQLASKAFLQKDCKLYGVIVNRTNGKDDNKIKDELMRLFSNLDIVVSTLPSIESLRNPNVREIANHTKAEVLNAPELLDNQINNSLVAAMNFENVISQIGPKSLIIVPSDRDDVILGSLVCHNSGDHPNISGILLTTYAELNPTIFDLVKGMPKQVPILKIENNTFEAANLVNNFHSVLSLDNPKKIKTALTLFEDNIDISSIESHIESIEIEVVTPKMFEYGLVQRAKANRKKIILPEGTEPRILKAAKELKLKNAVDVAVLGNEEAIRNQLAKLSLDLELADLEIIDPVNSPLLEEFAEAYYEYRKHKGVTLEVALDTMKDVSYFGTMMVQKGYADGMVSGAVHTTQHTIRPALQFVKTKPGVSVVSSVFFMCLEDRVLVYGDCAVNPNPNSEQLAEIAISSAHSATAFGLDPKVALLSYSSGSSGKGADVDKVRAAAEIVHDKAPEIVAEGPIQYDAAVDPIVGSSKLPDSPVAGKANVLIFPDLNTGNNTYKAVQRETGALAIGPMLQGLNKPVNDLSRGCTVEDIVNTVIITAIQAQLN